MAVSSVCAMCPKHVHHPDAICVSLSFCASSHYASHIIPWETAESSFRGFLKLPQGREKQSQMIRQQDWRNAVIGSYLYALGRVASSVLGFVFFGVVFSDFRRPCLVFVWFLWGSMFYLRGLFSFTSAFLRGSIDLLPRSVWCDKVCDRSCFLIES